MSTPTTPASAAPVATLQPGPVIAQGQLYLRHTVTESFTAAGVPQYIYPLIERFKVGEAWASNPWKCIWTGPAAQAFYRAHWPALKGGCALNVLLERIRLHTDANGSELHAHIHSASLAPTRRSDKAESPEPQPQPQPQPEHIA